jgi:hypothetical protein
MAKDERLYARFDIGMDEHPKIMMLSDAAFRALVEATMYSRRQRTDGFIPGPVARRKWGNKACTELCSNDSERPSFSQVDGGYRIHDFAKHQTTNADIEAKRESGRLGGLAKAGRRVAPATDSLEQKASNSLAKTETETETETSTSNEVDKTRLTALFDDAYSHWPKKVERKAALDKFKAIAKKMPPDELAGRIIRFGDAYGATTERQFTPALGVWLGKERWTDDLPSKPQSTNPDAWMNLKPTRTDQNLAFVSSLYEQQQQMEIES